MTLSFNLLPDYPLGDAVEAINKLATGILPASMTTSFQGTAQAFESSMQGLGLLLVMAFLVIYMVLGAGAESRQPLGLAVVGGLLFSQFLTLFVMPVFYVYMDRFRLWVGGCSRRHGFSA